MPARRGTGIADRRGMTSRIIEHREAAQGRPAEGKEPPKPGFDVAEASMLGNPPTAQELLDASPAPTRYRIVLSCSFDEEKPFPKPE